MTWELLGEFAVQLVPYSIVLAFLLTALNEAQSYDWKPTWREVRESTLAVLILWIPNTIICYIVFFIGFVALFGLLGLLSLAF